MTTAGACWGAASAGGTPPFVVLCTATGAGRPAVNSGRTASAPPANATAVRRVTARFLRRGRCFGMLVPASLDLSPDRLTRPARAGTEKLSDGRELWRIAR